MSPIAPSCILPRVAMTISFWTLFVPYSLTQSRCVVSASSSLFLLMCVCFHSSTPGCVQDPWRRDEIVGHEGKHNAEKLWSAGFKYCVTHFPCGSGFWSSHSGKERWLVICCTWPTGLSHGELFDPNYCLSHF
ncbi:hypothetical protein C8R43DRAFT_1022672 [Mycena crocata]|nr:hypothetical protein C8R43DRAFT_1022672 [Mycena crocata]